MNNNTKAISFWNFLKENTIEIPIIQRDYAQGRLGKENLRKNFLGDLKKAIDRKDNVKMKLDFVYGSVEGGKLNPLDGQQRLTTLWLLHWYIALRAGVLNEENCKIFQRFTYETRISSREFCKNLCNPKHFEKFDGNDIVGFITKQTWFYSAWKQDPTIQSMLRMLGGTKINDKNGDDIIDGIEELFDCPSECDIIKNTKCLLLRVFNEYWNKMTSDNCPIVFYHLPLQDFGLSDDLYIKMNARGKQLTSFENFKADLIGYITKQSENEQNEWKELLAPESGIPIKLDTDWTDIFWKNKSIDNKIDEIYFAFINRYFLQELICAKKEDNADLYSTDDLEKKNGSFRYLYGDKGDDSRLQYSGLDKYLFNDGKVISLSFFTSFRDTLNHFKPVYNGCKFFGGCCLNAHFPAWVDSKFEFIPKYDETGIITTLGQKERIVFLAISRYLKKGGFDSVSFKQWIRVVWNIVENSGIETIPAMIGCMRLIDELSEHSHTIYNFLSNPQSIIKSDFAKEQVAEEIAKAKQILNGFPRADGKSWEETIEKTESYTFFKGAIRFLFTNETGNDEDWYNFDKKWKNAKKYFKDSDKDSEKRWDVLCDYIHYADKPTLLNYINNYNIDENFWKGHLLNGKLTKLNHHFLMGEIQYCNDKLANDVIAILSKLKMHLWILRDWKRNNTVLTNYARRNDVFNNGYVYVVDTKRNQFIIELLLSNQNIISDIVIPEAWGEEYIEDKNSRYYRGLYTDFKYEGKTYRLYEDIVMQITEEGETEGFIISDNETKESFIMKLKNKN